MYGALYFTTSVWSSGVSTPETCSTPVCVIASAGSRRISRPRAKSFEVSGVPSCHFTSGRSCQVTSIWPSVSSRQSPPEIVGTFLAIQGTVVSEGSVMVSPAWKMKFMSFELTDVGAPHVARLPTGSFEVCIAIRSVFGPVDWEPAPEVPPEPPPGAAQATTAQAKAASATKRITDLLPPRLWGRAGVGG